MNVQTLCQQLPQWVLIAAWVIYEAADYAFSKTSAGGAIEALIEAPLKSIWSKINAPSK